MSERRKAKPIPYRIEVEKEGCNRCGGGEEWCIVGPDEVALGTTYLNRDEAEDMVDALTSAYQEGASSQGWKTLAEEVIDALKAAKIACGDMAEGAAHDLDHGGYARSEWYKAVTKARAAILKAESSK